MDDLIGRRAALDALEQNEEMINIVLDSLTLDYNSRTYQWQRRAQIKNDINTIRELPSAQPEHDCVLKQFGDCSYDKTGCSDCKIKAKIRTALSVQTEKAQFSEENVIFDCISRQAAINALENTDCELSSDEWNELTDAIMRVPSVHPEPCELCVDHGLEDGDTLYMSADWDGGIGFDYIREVHYCPKCGRRLKNG